MRTSRLTALAAIIVIISTCAGIGAMAQDKHSPTGTYKFAVKEGQDLFLDYYAPAKGSETSIAGHAKPTVLFAFGGGFFEGERDNPDYLPWFKMLNDEGYAVVSIDYRLGMKGVKTKGGVSSLKQFRHSAQIAAEDIFSATKYLIENGARLGIDANNLVVSGSSAGAIASLEADWLLHNGKATEVFPDGFRFAGVMPFAGAIISMEGKPRYATPPAPTAFFHGTDDKIVDYKKIHILKWGIFGSNNLVKTFKRNGYTYNIYRYKGHMHEIANSMSYTFPEQLRFLETVVTRGVTRSVDVTVEDPEVPKPSGSKNRKELYGDN